MNGSLDAHLNLVDLNVRGAVQLAGLLVPAMVDRGGGGVLFTASVAGRMPGPYMSTYAASKAFLLSFAEALRVEVADSGVHVTALMPGATDTEFFERAGMEDTKLGRSSKSDPVDVARAGFEALMNDRSRRRGPPQEQGRGCRSQGAPREPGCQSVGVDVKACRSMNTRGRAHPLVP